jgi:hypothetical protein
VKDLESKAKEESHKQNEVVKEAEKKVDKIK